MMVQLGMIPEEVINEKISPLVEQLYNILSEYKVYPWITIDWHEENTENEL